MRDLRSKSRAGLPVPAAALKSGPILGNSTSGAQNGPDGMASSLDALEAAYSAVRDRLDRLETDVRTLQSQNANRA